MARAASSPPASRVYPAEVDDRAGRLPAPAAFVLAAAAGLALDLAFPGTGWWFLAAPGVAALALAARGSSARRGALLGLVTGLVWFVPLLHWSGIYVGALPWLALAMSQAAFVALLGALLPAAWRVPGGRAGTVVAVAGLWVLQEGLRSRLPFGGFPWGRVAFSQADAPDLGWAALGGAPLVTAAVAAAGACLAVAVAAVPRSALGRRPTRAGLVRLVVRVLVPTAVAVGVVMAGPLARRAGDPDAGARPSDAARSVQVAAVQGNVPEAGLDFNAQRRAVLDNHVAATLSLAAQVKDGRVPAPDLVVWPENSSDIDPLVNADAYAEIGRSADSMGVPLLVGAVLQGPGEDVSNAAIVWGPGGTPGGGPGGALREAAPRALRRVHPLPLVLPPVQRQGRPGGPRLRRGRPVGLLHAGPARVGDVICFEVAYDDIVRDTVRAGADLLVVQTNNATFGYSDESTQQLAMSRLRAVESGRAVVHVSTVGVSGADRARRIRGRQLRALHPATS